jgi:hypothetical protein
MRGKGSDRIFKLLYSKIVENIKPFLNEKQKLVLEKTLREVGDLLHEKIVCDLNPKVEVMEEAQHILRSYSKELRENFPSSVVHSYTEFILKCVAKSWDRLNSPSYTVLEKF